MESTQCLAMQMGPAFLLWVVLGQINIPSNPFLLRMGKHVLPRLGNVAQHLAALDRGTCKENTGKSPFRLSNLPHWPQRHSHDLLDHLCCCFLKQAIPKMGSGKILSSGVGWGVRMFWSHWTGLWSPSVPCGWATTTRGVKSCRRMAHDHEYYSSYM